MSLILSGTDGLSDVDGTAATPAIRGTDANTGIFFPAADTIAFSEGGVEAARFDASGRLLIGNTASVTEAQGFTPSVQVSGTGTLASMSIARYSANASYPGLLFEKSRGATVGTNTIVSNGDNLGGISFQGANGTGFTEAAQIIASVDGAPGASADMPGRLGFYTTADGSGTPTERMRLDSSGNLGIGTTSPAATLEVSKSENGETGAIIRNATNGSNAGALLKFIAGTDFGQIIRFPASHGAKANQLYITNVGTNSPITFATQDTERMRLDSSGNLLVGTTDASGTAGIGFKFLPSATYSRTNQVGSTTSNADTTHEVYSTGAGAYRFYVGYGGTVFATNTTISAISDARFKENIRDLNAGLPEIMALKPRMYDWKEGKGADIKNARGFIAQEFEEVFPDLIDEWKDPAPEGEEPYKSVRQDLIPVLVKAIQEQQALITQLTARITALEGA